MNQRLNIYCDESCHLEHDGKNVMIVGAVWCPADQVRDAHLSLRNLKRAYGLADDFELKWTKASPAKLDFYRAALDYFFRTDHLHFRALVVPDKSILNHAEFPGQTHDQWYYKMYFRMLEAIVQPNAEHRIFLDYKDTQGGAKVRKLHEVLCNSIHDFERKAVADVRIVHSHEVGLLQLADLLIGAVCYANRRERGSAAKLALVEHMQARSGYPLTFTTFLKETKTNIFVWRPREPEA
jgi:hypothetical protein